MVNVKELDFENRISDMLAEENKQKYKDACKSNKCYKSITLKEYIGCTRNNIDVCEYIKCKYGIEFCSDKQCYIDEKSSHESNASLIISILVTIIVIALIIIFKDMIAECMINIMKHFGLGKNPWRSNTYNNIGGLASWKI